MKSFIVIVLGILVAVLLVSGAIAYTFMDELGVNMDNVDSKIKDKVSNVGSSDIVKEEVKENGQAGTGSYREVSYGDGGFRQFDSKTGELIGSSYESDQSKLNKGDFD